MSFDKDQVKGTGKEAQGKVEQVIGNLVGDPELEKQGADREAEGKLQGAWGKVKDAAGDALNDVKDALNKNADDHADVNRKYDNT